MKREERILGDEARSSLLGVSVISMIMMILCYKE